jgi:aryl-alcohol dehydrogenase-like predicted oxidoreductase
LSRREHLQLRPGYEISRVIRGGWQLGGGHGRNDRQAAIADLAASFAAGISTFDCADI